MNLVEMRARVREDLQDTDSQNRRQIGENEKGRDNAHCPYNDQERPGNIF